MSDTTSELDWVEKIGKTAFESIAEMVAALKCDYDRLEELREERLDWNADFEMGQMDNRPWDEANPDEAEELKELEAAAGECEDQDEARQRIEEDALSVEVRSGWTTPGETMEPEEFCILLCTGGPAVRIVGNLGTWNAPTDARLEVQDWFKPWTEYVPADDDVLLAYAECFNYGE